jgi:hypothetical protein
MRSQKEFLKKKEDDRHEQMKSLFSVVRNYYNRNPSIDLKTVLVRMQLIDYQHRLKSAKNELKLYQSLGG